MSPAASRPIDLMAVGLTTLDIAVHPVASLPGEEGQIVERIALSPAGTAAGTAYVAQRLGLQAAVGSAVGIDPQGQLVRSMLEAEGVDTTLLVDDGAMPTSTTVLPIRPNGDRPNWHMLGASLFAPVTPAMLEALDRTAAVHWAAVGFPGTAGQGAGFLAAAKARGAFVTCDLIAPSPAAAQDLDALLPHVDIFMPSLAELAVLFGKTDDLRAAADHFIAKGAGACLFKLGARGAALLTHDSVIEVPAWRIDPVDTTSCGDSVCAGFHAARHRGLSDRDAMAFACATAAQVASGIGTTGTLASYQGVVDFMATHQTATDASHG